MTDSVHPLRAWRERTGKTLADVAKATRSSRSWLSRVENGEAPSNRLLRRLIKISGLTANDFFGAVK